MINKIKNRLYNLNIEKKETNFKPIVFSSILSTIIFITIICIIDKMHIFSNGKDLIKFLGMGISFFVTIILIQYVISRFSNKNNKT
ncbi:hypothetical protein KPL37_18645 [Clostridium frigoris]|uniref:Uncharacterized protein n=1 Tax=Clostridium frigoris TaxID=205327 RepID=A0ABS6BYQ8_9CLOT|nr:hypothetical protein [Clostridium frigoris]MBU3161710.1 hypothetical protein [Clostridium frigoris]